MSYTILDLLDKLTMIERKGCHLYRSIMSASSDNVAIKSVAAVLAREEERHVEFYQEMKSEFATQKGIEIEFDIYDKASNLLHEFQKRLDVPNINNAQDLLKFALSFEKENVALLLDIQGRLVRKQDDADTARYKALSRLLEEEITHVTNLEAFVK